MISCTTWKESRHLCIEIIEEGGQRYATKTFPPSKKRLWASKKQLWASKKHTPRQKNDPGHPQITTPPKTDTGHPKRIFLVPKKPLGI